MEALAGPVIVVSALLALAGAMKIVQPASTAGALRAMALPSSTPLVRLLGGAEVAIGVIAGVTLWPPALLLVAALYLGFTAFVTAALGAHQPIQSCGCLGRADTPPSVVHVVLDVAAAGVALGAAVTDTPSLSATVSAQPAAGVPFLLLVAVSVYLCVTAISVLPLTLRSRTSA